MHKKKILFSIIFILLIISILFYSFSKLSTQYAEAVLSNSISKRFYDSINEYLSNNKNLLQNLSEYKYNTAGKLVSIEVDSYKINVIKSELTNLVINRTANIKNESFTVPLANIFNIKVLYGGPAIKINIVPIGKVSMDTINELNSVGINHTLHKIALRFTIEFKAAMPFNDVSFETNTEIALYEGLIIGDVPNVYIK